MEESARERYEVVYVEAEKPSGRQLYVCVGVTLRKPELSRKGSNADSKFAEIVKNVTIG